MKKISDEGHNSSNSLTCKYYPDSLEEVRLIFTGLCNHVTSGDDSASTDAPYTEARGFKFYPRGVNKESYDIDCFNDNEDLLISDKVIKKYGVIYFEIYFEVCNFEEDLIIHDEEEKTSLIEFLRLASVFEQTSGVSKCEDIAIEYCEKLFHSFINPKKEVIDEN